MPGLNSMLLLVISDLNRRSADASVSLASRAAPTRRVLHVAKGCLIGSDSSVVAERLGDMLAKEGRLDPVLIEPVANEARRRGTLLGYQLIADGLLTPTDLASALERQARLRLESAMATSGSVLLSPKTPVEPLVRVPLGGAVAMAFRERIKLEPIKLLVADRPKQPIPLDLQGELFNRLELGPSESKICRSLAGGQSLEQVMGASTAPDSVTRLAGVLVALGLWA